jgi:hypothetical protein
MFHCCNTLTFGRPRVSSQGCGAFTAVPKFDCIRMYSAVLYCTSTANAWGPTWLALEQTYNLEQTRLAFFLSLPWHLAASLRGTRECLFADRRHLELLATSSHCFYGRCLGGAAPEGCDARTSSFAYHGVCRPNHSPSTRAGQSTLQRLR